MKWYYGILSLFIIGIVSHMMIIILSKLISLIKANDESEKIILLKLIVLTCLSIVVFSIWAGCAKELINIINIPFKIIKIFIIGLLFEAISVSLIRDYNSTIGSLSILNIEIEELSEALSLGIVAGMLLFLIFIFFDNLHNIILFNTPKEIIDLLPFS
ncbi:MAG: hypothetical protein R2771_15425 [Saprospiraceae bacterium]